MKTEEIKIDPSVKAPDLYNAAKENNSAKIIQLLNESVPPSYIDKTTGYDSLYWAVKHGNTKATKLILDSGGSEHYKSVKRFLEGYPGEKLDDQSEKILRNSPLLSAAYEGNINIVWMLLIDGFSVDDTDALGNSALHLAAAGGRTKVLKILLASGGNLKIFNKFRNRPIDVTINHEDHDLIVAEMERRNNIYGFSPEAAKEELLEKVKAT